MALSRSTSPGPSESVFSADESFTPLSDIGTDGYEGSIGRAGSLALAAAGPTDLSQLNLVNLKRPWNEPGEANRQAFHAISTVLSHPSRKPAPLRASRVPLPAAPPVDPIPKTNRKDLDAYVQHIGPEWERYQKSLSDGSTGTDDRLGSTLTTSAPSLSAIPEVFFTDDFNLGNPHTFDLVTSVASVTSPRRHSLASPNASFASLPPILEPLEESLDGHPRDQNTQGSSTRPTASQSVDLDDPKSNHQLQARLSSHLDLVEQHLVLEISQRSTSFFTALTNLQDLQTESETCLSRIESLQQELKALDEGQAQVGLEAVNLSRSLGGLKAVDGAIKEMRGIDEAVGMVRNLVANDDVYGALDLWEEVDGWLKRKGKEKEIVAGQGSRGSNSRKSSIRLRSSSVLGELAEDEEGEEEEEEEGGSDAGGPSLKSTDLVPSQLGGRNTSSSTASARTIRPPTKRSSRRTDVDLDLTATSALSHLPQTLAALSLSIAAQLELELTGFLSAELSGRKKVGSDVALEERLRPLLSGLMRARETSRIVGVFREVALSETRDAARKFVTSGSNDAADINSAALAKRLKGLPFSDFLSMETSMFEALMNCLKSTDKTTSAIETVLKEADSALNVSLTGELHDVLSAAAELAHSRASKVMGVRTDQHALLPLNEFILMFRAGWDFVVDCELLCRKMIVGLRGTMVVQAKTFLQTYHSQRLSNSARLVENEVWAPEEPSSNQQHALDLIIESAMSDPAELVMTTDGSVPESKKDGDKVTEKSSTLRIEDRSFYVVSATLASMELLVDYLRLVINIELITTDVMSKIIEYLKSFNSRTCQVVLGAGAMRSAGLKNITAKHLALASQSLSVMVTLIPYIREAVRRHLSAKQAVMLVEFDKLKRDFQEHQNEIHAKLIAIMGDRLAIHITTFKEIDWEATPAKAGKPSDYIELLIKETSQLHKILSKYLPESTVELVISQVFASINNGLAEVFSAVELKSDAAKTRLALDAMHLVKKLSALPNVTPIPATLPTLVKDKYVPRRPVGQTMANLMRRVSDRDANKGKDDGDKEEAPASSNDTLAPPGASSLGTPLSSRGPSELPSPSNDSESELLYTEQILEAALQNVVSPSGLPPRTSSLSPSPLSTSSPLLSLPPSPSGENTAVEASVEAESVPEPVERDDPTLPAPMIETALPPIPPVDEEETPTTAVPDKIDEDSTAAEEPPKVVVSTPPVEDLPTDGPSTVEQPVDEAAVREPAAQKTAPATDEGVEGGADVEDKTVGEEPALTPSTVIEQEAVVNDSTQAGEGVAVEPELAEQAPTGEVVLSDVKGEAEAVGEAEDVGGASAEAAAKEEIS